MGKRLAKLRRSPATESTWPKFRLRHDFTFRRFLLKLQLIILLPKFGKSAVILGPLVDNFLGDGLMNILPKLFLN